MPQNYGYIPDTSNYGYIPDSHEPPPSADNQTWLEWAISNGLRVIPPIGGAMLGGIPGGIAGGALGEMAGEAYDVYNKRRESINPFQVGVGGLLGGIPAFGKAPGVGATAEELMNYAMQAPFRGAAEGAIIGAGSSVPQAWAEGQSPTWSGALHGAEAGSLFGLVGGGVLGGIPALRRAHGMEPTVPPPIPDIPPLSPHLQQDTLFPPGLPKFGHPMEEPHFQTPPREIPHDQIPGQMNLGFANADEGYTQPNFPWLDEFGQSELGANIYGPQKPLVNLPPQSGGMPPPPPPNDGGGGGGDRIVVLPSPTRDKVAALKQQGFTPFTAEPGTGFPRMIRRVQPPTDIPPQATVTPTATAGVRGVSGNQKRTGVPDELIPVGEGETIVIKNPNSLQLKNLEKFGYQIAGRNDATGEVTFKLVNSDALAQHMFGADEEPSPQLVNPNENQVQLPESNEDIAGVRYHNLFENVPRNEPIDLGPNPTLEQLYNQPAAAKVTGGGLKASMNVTRGITNLTKDYSSPLEGIMAREGLQNALDASDLRGADGETRIRIRNKAGSATGGTIEIHDNGAGMDEGTLANKLVEVFGSGKEGDPNATGGKGIGSATYLYGGKHVEIETVAIDPRDGQKYKITAKGTPEQFFSDKGSDYERVLVDKNTPTYTRMKVDVKDDQNLYNARRMTSDIIKHSRNRSSKIIYDSTGGSAGDHITTMKPSKYNIIEESQFKSTSGDKVIGDMTYKNNDIKIQIPKFDPTKEVGGINVHVLNNGMYQFSKYHNFEGYSKGTPDHVVVDIHPKVDDLHDDYPFTNTREHMKDDVSNFIDKYITDNISGPAVERRKNQVQELYDSMTHVQLPGLRRKTVIFDPGNRMTPAELDKFSNHPVIKDLLSTYDSLVDEILQFANKPEWSDRLESVGIGFFPDANGYHIPNPTTGKSTILFNPFPRMEMGTNPSDNAWRHTQTGLHEVAHVGKESGEPIISFRDVNHPDMPQFFKDYLNQLQEHGDIVSNTGHGMGFAQRLGEVYASFGPANTRKYSDAFHEIFTGGKLGDEYSPEFQKLLSGYSESRGRDATTEDFLSRTGAKQADSGPTGTENIPSSGEVPGDGTTPVAKNRRRGESTAQKMFNLPRGLSASLDLSGAFRQGSGLMHEGAYWKAWEDMVKAGGSEEAYKAINNEIRSREMFQRRMNTRTAKIEPSFAEKAGLAIQDLRGNAGTREEAIPSDWAETGGMFGKNNPVQRTYQSTIGKGVRASNRAYTAFLNKVRADTFEKLINDAMTLHESNPTVEINPRTNLAFAKEIAEFVNTASGRGPLKLAVPKFQLHDPVTGSIKPRFKLTEVNAEKFAHGALGLTNILFSPRLIAARMRMLNPFTYMMASPFVRKQYMKSALSSASLWMGIAGVAAAAGAQVSTDMDSADFGKVRIGDKVRLDPGAGFQQFIVAAHRMASGRYVSSASSKEFTLGEGYKADTRGDVLRRFAANKLHPVVKFAYDILHASERVPVPITDRIMQMYVPLVTQDMLEIAKENPSLLPTIGPLAVLGLGTQIYGKDDLEGSKFINPKDDYLFKGGSLVP